MFESTDKADIETQRSKDHFCMYPFDSRDHGMSRFENGLDNGVRSLAGRSFSWNSFLSRFLHYSFVSLLDLHGVYPLGHDPDQP